MNAVVVCESLTETTQSSPPGWYWLKRSSELLSGEICPVQAFEHDLVLYRTESGVAALQDAMCPHLGANMAYEGTVEGEALRCSFHGWEFNAGDGKCSYIPYRESIPEQLCIYTWCIEEQNGDIYLWFHPEKIAPQWALASMPGA